MRTQKKLVVSFPRDCHACARNDNFFICARNENLFGACLLTECATSKTEHEPQRRRANRTPSLTMSTSDCAVLLRSRRTKRGGIISERHLFMRVLSVVPRYAVTVGSLKGGTAIWARRVKQFVQWTDCSQSEQGGLPRKRRSPNT